MHAMMQTRMQKVEKFFVFFVTKLGLLQQCPPQPRVANPVAQHPHSAALPPHHHRAACRLLCTALLIPPPRHGRSGPLTTASATQP